jgi:hypothetical protein
MNATRSQRMVRPATRHGLRLAGDTTNKLKADPEYEAHQRVGDGALRKLAATPI